MEAELRQIRVDEAESFRFAVDAVAREHRYIALLESPPIEQVRDFVKRNVERGYPQIVAVRDGAVVGWCNIPPAARAVSAHVGDLFMGLVAEYRGKGLGESLIRHALSAADNFGFKRVELGVFAANPVAATLYRKVGFTEEGVKRGAILIDGTYHDEIVMARLKP
ncbi:N-acetyltransferase family protein [Bradyrhizobium guangdongense]